MFSGKRLRKLRKENNLTQKELSKKLGIGESTLSHYERGDRDPDSKTLRKISNFFGVSTDYLLNNSNERNSADKIKKAISDDPELTDFWDKLSKRDDLKLLFKQTKDMEPDDVKRIIRIIKAIEKEEQDNL